MVAGVSDGEPNYDLKYLTHQFEAWTSPWIGGWDVASVRAARDAHALGQFSRSARLADALSTDPRVFAALLQRIGPSMSLPLRFRPAERAWEGKPLAEAVRDETETLFAADSKACPPSTRTTLFRTSAMMGAWIGQNVYTPRRDGSRIDVELRPWPMRAARWRTDIHRYQVQTKEGLITIEPGDGKWVVVEPHGFESFLFGALRPIALVWADRAYAIRDRSNHSEMHGSGKLIGTLPEDVPIDGDEGRDFEKMLKDLYKARSGGIKQFGSSIEVLEAKTLAYKVFGEIIGSTNTDIVIPLLGTDGTIEKGGVYTPPSFEGVRFDFVEMDLRSAGAALTTQFARPWTILNYGRDDVVTEIGWMIPDLREQARRGELAEQHEAYNRAVAAYRDNGFEVTQEVADRLALEYGVRPTKLAPKPPSVAPIADPNALPPAPTPQQQESTQKQSGDLAAA
jgi:hypothetical protein